MAHDKRDSTAPSYQFRRAKAGGLVEVINENFYVVAEYNERTGVTKWQRLVLASQKDLIEKWLAAHYPARG